MTDHLYRLLDDIAADVARVRRAISDDERPPQLTEDEIHGYLADVSNRLDELLSDMVNRPASLPQTGVPIQQARP